MNNLEVTFSGELMPGAALEQVQANLAHLFKMDAQRVMVLFTGRRVVIKSKLSAEEAERYRTILAKAGAVVQIETMTPKINPASTVSAAAPSSAPAAQTNASQTSSSTTNTQNTEFKPLEVKPRDLYMAAFSDVEAPDFGMAAVGSDLQDEIVEIETPDLDLSGISLLPAGSDMGEIKDDTPPVNPDISHLKLID